MSENDSDRPGDPDVKPEVSSPSEEVTETPPEEAEPVEASADTEEAPDTEQEPEEPPKKRSRRDRRVAALLRQNEAKDEEIARLMRQVPQQVETPKAAQDDPQPKQDDFDDFNEYVRADARWAARQETRELTRQQDAAIAQERDRRESAEMEARWNDSHEAAIDDHDDYEIIYDSIGTALYQMPGKGRTHAQAIKTADAPAEIVYHLGKNPKEFAKFTALSGLQLLKAVGRLEERINIQKEQRSKAPPPVKPVTGRPVSTNALSDNLSQKEWMARRNKQLGR